MLVCLKAHPYLAWRLSMRNKLRNTSSKQHVLLWGQTAPPRREITWRGPRNIGFGAHQRPPVNEQSRHFGLEQVEQRATMQVSWRRPPFCLDCARSRGRMGAWVFAPTRALWTVLRQPFF